MPYTSRSMSEMKASEVVSAIFSAQLTPTSAAAAARPAAAAEAVALPVSGWTRSSMPCTQLVAPLTTCIVSLRLTIRSVYAYAFAPLVSGECTAKMTPT